MWWLLLIAAASSEPVAQERGYCSQLQCVIEPNAFSELGATAGAQVLGFTFSGGSSTQAFVVAGGYGRFRPEKKGLFVDKLQLEGGTVVVIPAAGGNTYLGGALAARVGLVLGHFAFAVGAVARLDATPVSPFAIVPSITFNYRPGQFGLHVALFEDPQGPLGRVAFEWRNYSVGYVLPLGGELRGRFAITRTLALDARVSGYGLPPAFGVVAMLGLVHGHGLFWKEAP